MFREYGLEGPGVRGFVKSPLLGPGLLNRPGPTLFERPEGVTDPALCGVGARLGVFLYGDSGRGNDGRPIGLNCGLGARAPGPTDWANLGSEGVEGLKLGFSVVDRLKLLLYDGVVGVSGKLSVDKVAEERFRAL